MGFLSSSDDKASACSAGDPDSIPGLGGYPEEGNVSLKCIHYPCLESSMDRGACKATVHGVAESDRTESERLTHTRNYLSSVTHSVMCNSMWPHGL